MLRIFFFKKKKENDIGSAIFRKMAFLETHAYIAKLYLNKKIFVTIYIKNLALTSLWDPVTLPSNGI